MKKKQIYTSFIFCVVLVIILGIKPIISHIRGLCQNKYDFDYNVKREKLGIPIIPKNWRIKQREPKFIWWTGPENIVGHNSKTIAFSGCDINSELDLYTLSLQAGKRRWVDIEYKYGVESHKDTIVYNYQIEHSAAKISKKTADSIFNAEHINKDY
jgi:hypothetical protein